MIKQLPQSLLFIVITMLFAVNVTAQTSSLTVFDNILFYDGYAPLVPAGDLYEPIPAEVLRHSNSRYAIQLTEAQLNSIGNKLTMDVTLKAACDNYDRIARVYLAFVPAGQTTYDSNAVERVELGRFITPFMNKNNSPTEVPFSFNIDNAAEIFSDTALRANFDIWVELDVFGVPYAAQQQVAGCAGRIDTFYGTVVFNSIVDVNQTYPNPNFLMSLSCDENLNNYNATDVPGETTKIIDFTLNQTVEDVTLYLITSNHGANAGGEEYERRDHFLYLDNDLILEYIPGGKSCEPYRQFNTQGNGIYSPTPRTTRAWLDFNNWCPGDVIPNREIYLGTLTAGQHQIKLDVPDAVFVNGEGYIPVSMYLQNRNSYQSICIDPTDLVASGETYNSVDFEWQENGSASQWEVMYGRTSNTGDETIIPVFDTQETIDNLTDNSFYSFYVRSVCDVDFNSNWVGPVTKRTELGIEESNFETFQFYPNPTQGSIFLQASVPIDTITIYDTLGKAVLTKNIGSLTSEIELSEISSGLYFMDVTINGAARSYKLIAN